MKKLLSLVLSVLMLPSLGLGASRANDDPPETSRKALLARKVKAGVAQLGAGKSSVVRIVLYDKTKYHGHITQIGEDSFIVADAKTGATAPIAYLEVKGIKGNNLSTGAKVGIGVGIAAAVAVVIAIVRGRPREEKGPGTGCQVSGVSPENCPPGCICIQ